MPRPRKPRTDKARAARDASKQQTNKQQTTKSRLQARFNYRQCSCCFRIVAYKIEPAKRISPITSQALIPTTRRLAWLRLTPSYHHRDRRGPQPNAPKPTKADTQNVVQIITSDKVKTQAYCDLTKLEDRVKAFQQNTDTKTVETFIKQAEALIDKLGPEYFELMDGLEQVDPQSSEAKEFMSILSELDKRCTK